MGNYIFHLIKEVIAADRKKENVYHLYISRRNKEYFKEVLSLENVSYSVIPNLFLSYVGKVFYEQCVIPIQLVQKKIDVYHAPGFALPMISMSRKTKYVVTIADMTFFSHSQYHLGFKNIYFRWIIPKSIKKANAVIAISENTREDICTHFKNAKEKTKTVYLGVDENFKRKKANKNASKKVHDKYNLSGGYVLYVGVLEPRKNIEGLLQAFNEIKKTNKKIKLVIAGKTGWMYEQIFSLVKELRLNEQVTFTGYVDDEELYWLYREAICLCYPSFYEGFGLPVLEAMAVGCSVITSNNSSLKEIARGAGILVDPHNQKEIVAALTNVIENKKLRTELIIKGKQRAEQFSWKKMGEETLSLYQNIVG